MDDRLSALLEQYRDVFTYEDMRLFLSSVSLLKKATGGWGEVAIDFKGGDATDARILLTQKRQKDKSP